MKTYIALIGSIAMALATTAITLPTAADAASKYGGGGARAGGHAGGHGGGYAGGYAGGHRGVYARQGGFGGNGGSNGGYYGGYYGGYCGPIQVALGLCGPYVY
jgi:hypothetical protein